MARSCMRTESCMRPSLKTDIAWAVMSSACAALSSSSRARARPALAASRRPGLSSRLSCAIASSRRASRRACLSPAASAAARRRLPSAIAFFGSLATICSSACVSASAAAPNATGMNDAAANTSTVANRSRVTSGLLLLLLGRKLVVSLVEVRHDVLLVLREELQAELAVAERHLRFELGQRRDLPILAQVDRFRIPQRFVVVAGLALLLVHELAALLGVAGGERR